MLISLLILTGVLLVWTTVLRFIYFSRDPQYPKNSSYNCIYSPAEGTVVYTRSKLNPRNLLTIDKKGVYNSYFRISDYLDPQDTYTQLGIYMTQYDNHHYLNSIQSDIVNIECKGFNNDAPMFKFIDSLFSIIGIKFIDWLNRSVDFISHNQQWIISYKNGVVVVITMDKYVNKCTLLTDKRNKSVEIYPLAFIHRGSQTDIFIPESMDPKIIVKPMDKVSYFTNLLYYKNR